jgi:hypothetical protein
MRMDWGNGIAVNRVIMEIRKGIIDVRTIIHWFLDKRICRFFPTKRMEGA